MLGFCLRVQFFCSAFLAAAKNVCFSFALFAAISLVVADPIENLATDFTFSASVNMKHSNDLPSVFIFDRFPDFPNVQVSEIDAFGNVVQACLQLLHIVR